MVRWQVARGVTLMELLIAVAVVALLARLAWPAYTQQVAKGYRASAQAVLADIAQRQQQHLADHRAYATDPQALGVRVPPEVAARYRFEFTVDASTPPAYTATAVPLADSPQAALGPLSITSEGRRLPAGTW